MKRLFSLLLAAMLLIPCLLAGCNKNDAVDETTTAGTTTAETTPEETTSSGTPSDDITPEQPPLESTALTAVTIVGGNTPAELTAISELEKYLSQKGVSIVENGFPITI